MIKTPKLLPCPFCGRLPNASWITTFGDNRHRDILCLNPRCNVQPGVRVYQASKMTACDARYRAALQWNTRTIQTNDETRRADQLALNCEWLIARIDRIHRRLCPGKRGTWQQRAERAVQAAEADKGITQLDGWSDYTTHR